MEIDNLKIKVENYKTNILEKICYTELVYGRISKKLKTELSKEKVEKMVLAILNETEEANYRKIGKNIYVENIDRNIKLTINSYTNRLITANILNKKRTPNSGLA